MLKSVPLLWLLLLVVLLQGSPSVAQVSITPLGLYSSTLPNGVGKVLLYKYCITCHGVELVQKRLDERRGGELRAWEDLVYEMISSWGAPIEIYEVEPIAQYLLNNYGPQTVANSQSGLEALFSGASEGTLIMEKCVACHDERVTRQLLQSRSGFPSSVWKKILERMGAYGAPITKHETEQLSVYLAKSLDKTDSPNQKKSNQDLYAFLPEGEGKDLVVAICLSCHGALEFKERVEEHPVAEEQYWEPVINRMRNQWKAPLEVSEMEMIVAYLNSHFGSRR